MTDTEYNADSLSHWTQERVIEAFQRPLNYEALNSLAGRIIRDLIAERDRLLLRARDTWAGELNELHARPASTWRLPDDMGGATVEVIDWSDRGGLIRHPVYGEMTVEHAVLVEVRPPSIDDPVEWPLEMTNEGCWVIRLREPTIDKDRAACIELKTPEGEPASGVLLSADELLHLAQAAWRRYQAVTGGGAK